MRLVILMATGDQLPIHTRLTELFKCSILVGSSNTIQCKNTTDLLPIHSMLKNNLVTSIFQRVPTQLCDRVFQVQTCQNIKYKWSANHTGHDYRTSLNMVS